MQPDFLTGSILDTLDGTYGWMIFMNDIMNDKWLFDVIGEEILFKWFLNICIKSYLMWVIFETDDNSQMMITQKNLRINFLEKKFRDQYWRVNQVIKV